MHASKHIDSVTDCALCFLMQAVTANVCETRMHTGLRYTSQCYLTHIFQCVLKAGHGGLFVPVITALEKLR